MKEKKDELTWNEIFKNYLLIRTAIPLVLTIIFFMLFGDTSGKGNDLIVGLGIVLSIGSIIGFLTFLNVAIVKLFNLKSSNEDKDV